MDGIRRLAARRWVTGPAATVLAVLALGVGATPAWARVDPPDVVGLSIADASAKLREWDRSVQISVEPSPKVFPIGLDRSTVVVARSTWLNPVQIDPEAPRIQLDLGAVVPDLAGLTRAEASTALTPRGFTAVARPERAQADWVVNAQDPSPGSILRLGGTVSVALVPLVAPTTDTPIDEGGRPPSLVVFVATGAGLALAVLALLGTLAIRRVRRGRGTRAPSVDVRAFHGQIRGPDLTEPEPGPSLSVRLEPHQDAGTVTLEEVRR